MASEHLKISTYMGNGSWIALNSFIAMLIFLTETKFEWLNLFWHSLPIAYISIVISFKLRGAGNGQN